jgi:hypothetical protein
VNLPVVSAHAVERYMERTGCKSPERARNKIEYCFINGRRLKTNPKSAVIKVYGGGFVLVIDTQKTPNLIVTIYRPTAPHIRKKVYAAHKQKRKRVFEAEDGEASV